MLIANDMEVWGISSDVGDAHSIPCINQEV